MCLTVLFEANRDMAGCFCQRTCPRSIGDVFTTHMVIEETRTERQTVTFMSIDRYAWYPMERYSFRCYRNLRGKISDHKRAKELSSFGPNDRLEPQIGSLEDPATKPHNYSLKRLLVRITADVRLPVQCTSLRVCLSCGRCLPSYAHGSSGSRFWCALVGLATVGTEGIAGTYFKSFNLENLCNVCGRPHSYGWRLVGMAKRSRSRWQQYVVAVAFERRGRACFKANTLRALRIVERVVCAHHRHQEMALCATSSINLGTQCTRNVSRPSRCCTCPDLKKQFRVVPHGPSSLVRLVSLLRKHERMSCAGTVV